MVAHLAVIFFYIYIIHFNDLWHFPRYFNLKDNKNNYKKNNKKPYIYTSNYKVFRLIHLYFIVVLAVSSFLTITYKY